MNIYCDLCYLAKALGLPLGSIDGKSKGIVFSECVFNNCPAPICDSNLYLYIWFYKFRYKETNN